MRVLGFFILTIVILVVLGCTPKSSSAVSTTDTTDEAVNGAVTVIADSPVLDMPKQLTNSGLSNGGPVNVGAFQTTAAQEARIDSFLSVMTVEEKVGQMNQYTSFYDITGPAPTGGNAQQRFNQVKQGLVGSMLNVTGAEETRKIQELAMQSRLKIPMIFAFDVIHGFKTQFPVPIAEAATFDLDMIQQAARWAAIEATAYGINWTFAPMVDVSPDARWGRIVEGSGEDPYFGAQVAAARVRGFQGNRLSDNTSMAACAKHFAGYGYAIAGRDYNTAEVGDYTLYNDILPPFKAAAEAGSATFMNGFHTIGGQPVTGSKSLQRAWLKGKHEWPGLIVSDWGSIGEMIAHGSVDGAKSAAAKAIKAGNDMDMESRAYIEELPALVKAGEVDEKLLDDAVRRILRVKFALGLFDNPYKNCDLQRQKEATSNKEMIAAAINTAAASAVLLKNEGESPLLPLNPNTNKKVVVIGDLATNNDSPQGTWSLGADRNTGVTLVDALKAQMSTPTNLSVSSGPSTLTKDSKQDFLWEVFPNTSDRIGLDAAVASAKTADVVIMALGEPGFMSGEARSRTNIGLPGLQQELFDAVHAVNPNVVVVLYSGRPLAIEQLAEKAPSILLAWQPGTHGNHGIANVLFGKYNPSGKLPVSFPYTVGQEPLTYREYSTGRPGYRGRPDGTQMVFSSHYMDAPVGALFPFGHGLSYTSYQVSKLKAAAYDSEYTNTGNVFRVSATVSNTGKMDGDAVLQVYINDPVASRVRPIKELKGFRKIGVAAGASQNVSFELTDNELQFWTADDGWHTEPGKYKIWVGLSSEELGEPVEIEVKEKARP